MRSLFSIIIAAGFFLLSFRNSQKTENNYSVHYIDSTLKSRSWNKISYRDSGTTSFVIAYKCELFIHDSLFYLNSPSDEFDGKYHVDDNGNINFHFINVQEINEYTSFLDGAELSQILKEVKHMEISGTEILLTGNKGDLKLAEQ